jgi:hypothetical protein
MALPRPKDVMQYLLGTNAEYPADRALVIPGRSI